MKRISMLCTLATVFFLVGCATPTVPPPTHTPIATPTPQRTATPTPAAIPTAPATATFVSVNEILNHPNAFRDRYVQVQGYGFTTATFPLCAGYVGLDRRTLFIDAQRNQITADVKWKPPAGARMYDPDHVRVCEGYVRIFSGEIGCPGSIKVETFPYLEFTTVHFF